MPYYQFNVICELTDEQRQQLVDRITYIHTRKFSVATFLVNVGFLDQRAQGDAMIMYRAGSKHKGNMVQCYIRPGGRERSQFDELCLEVQKAWNDVLNGGRDDVKGPTELGGIFVFPTIQAAWEHGILAPEGGKDKEWLKDNRKTFEKYAKEGDRDFEFLLKEMDTRKELGCC